MTRAQAVQLVVGVIGQRITTAHGYTNPYGAQCLSLIAWYTEQLGYSSIMPGYNAIDVYNRNPLNLPKVSTPQPGDIFFMDYVAPDGTSLGHTGVVTDVSGGGIWSVDENWVNSNLTNGSAAARVFHPFNQIKGYLRPQLGENVNKEKLNEAIAYFYLATNMGDKAEGYATEAQIKGWADQIMADPNKWAELAYGLYKGKPNENMRYRAFNAAGGYPALEAQVATLKAQLETATSGDFQEVDLNKVYVKKVK